MSRSYQVGYGKPPLETRFRKGQSGNPKGRAKGVKNVSTVIVEAMTQTVTVTIDGRRVQMSKLQAAATQQANKAAAGDPKATGLMFQMLSA